MENVCCEKCWGWVEGWNVPIHGCKDSECECHTAHQSSQSKGKEVTNEELDAAIALLPKEECLCGQKGHNNFNHHTPDRCWWKIERADWEAEFDKVTEPMRQATPQSHAWIKAFISKLLSDNTAEDEKIAVEMYNEALAAGTEAERERQNDCTCKEKWTFGVVHLKDKPCYLPPHQTTE